MPASAPSDPSIDLLSAIGAPQSATTEAPEGDAHTNLEKVQRALDLATGQDVLAELDKRQSITTGPERDPLAEIDNIRHALDLAVGKVTRAESETRENDIRAAMARSIPKPAAMPPIRVAKTPASRQLDSVPLSTVADLGHIVQQKRKEMKLTQQQFADLAGVGRRFVLELEAGKPTLEFGRVLKVCQAAGIDVMAAKR